MYVCQYATTAAAVTPPLQSPLGALALGRGMQQAKKPPAASNFRYQESTLRGVVMVIVGSDGVICAGKHAEKLEPVLLELAGCHAFVLAANVLSDRVGAAAANVLILRRLGRGSQS